jgi:hypothetical protein
MSIKNIISISLAFLFYVLALWGIPSQITLDIKLIQLDDVSQAWIWIGVCAALVVLFFLLPTRTPGKVILGELYQTPRTQLGWEDWVPLAIVALFLTLLYVFFPGPFGIRKPVSVTLDCKEGVVLLKNAVVCESGSGLVEVRTGDDLRFQYNLPAKNKKTEWIGCSNSNGLTCQLRVQQNTQITVKAAIGKAPEISLESPKSIVNYKGYVSVTIQKYNFPVTVEAYVTGPGIAGEKDLDISNTGGNTHTFYLNTVNGFNPGSFELHIKAIDSENLSNPLFILPFEVKSPSVLPQVQDPQTSGQTGAAPIITQPSGSSIRNPVTSQPQIDVKIYGDPGSTTASRYSCGQNCFQIKWSFANSTAQTATLGFLFNNGRGIQNQGVKIRMRSIQGQANVALRGPPNSNKLTPKITAELNNDWQDFDFNAGIGKIEENVYTCQCVDLASVTLWRQYNPFSAGILEIEFIYR